MVIRPGVSGSLSLACFNLACAVSQSPIISACRASSIICCDEVSAIRPFTGGEPPGDASAGSGRAASALTAAGFVTGGSSEI